MPGVVIGNGNCGYTVLTGTATATATTATSTFTLNTGPGSPGLGVASPGSYPGAFYGFFGIAVGTYTATSTATGATPVVTAYDILPAVPSTAASTNTLCSGTLTAANQTITPAGTGNARFGVRYGGSLVVTMTGASTSIANALWD